MANLILPDRNIYIGAIRAGGDPFQEFAAGIDDRDWEFATCGMVVLEVCRGLRDPSLLKRFRERFAVMIFVPTTNQIWERAAQLAWSLDRQGRVLPAQDILIAAHALQINAAVLTADAHFQQIPGLRILARLE
ncbi:MAG: PIN domain-containing protein [Verrucomicrobia bacterium]|nr:PIN domain-containing protein [Verrucomicrobiota bacterium]